MQRMERSNEILTEIQEIAPVLGKSGPSRNPYTLPVGFFENFPEILMLRIRMDSAKGLEIGKKITEISSPQEIIEISPLLADLQHKTTYQVPQGYFESFNTMISDSGILYEDASLTPEFAPVVQITSGKIANIYPEIKVSEENKVFNFSRVLKYSVAACIFALLGLTLFNMNHSSVTDPINGLTTISDQDMANYLDAGDIHWTPGISSNSETASVEFSDNDIHELFSNVSDDELEQYVPSLPLDKGSVN
jgi:hypothetical protein